MAAYHGRPRRRRPRCPIPLRPPCPPLAWPSAMRPTTTRWPWIGRGRTSGRPACSRVTSGCGRAIRASARRSPSASAGWMRRSISSTGSRASRGSGTRSSRRATGRLSWPAWAAAASPRTCSTGRSAAMDGYLELRVLDSTDPAYVVGHARRPRPHPNARHHRLQVRDDDRAERLPGVRLGSGRGRARRCAASPVRGAGRVLRGDHRPGPQRRGDRASRRLPRGVHQPARHRRALFGADLRRPRAGVADRDRSRCAARFGRRRCSGPVASRTRRSTRACRSGSPSGRSPGRAATS